MAEPEDVAPSRPPRLARGLRVVRRGRDRLQVGLHADRRAVLPRTPVVEQTLLDLLGGDATGTDPGTAEVLETLRAHGCLRPDPTAPPPRVAVVEHGRPAVPAGSGAAGELLEAAGLRLTPWLSTCDVALVVSWTELDRDVLDPLLRSGTPHLVVRLVDGGAVLGPFVVPGRTACLRCTDAHRTLEDPDHVAVTARYVRAVGVPDGVDGPDVADHLGALAVAWAVRDVLAHLAGTRPATWSATWHLPPDGSAPAVQEWSRHPGCGCCWAADARPSGTMGP
ncbi:hypothetical protein GCM10027596_23940 [Nocardioides korecus]